MASLPAAAQSTQAYLTGTADDSVSGHTIPNTTISCSGLSGSAAIPGQTDAAGRFTFAALSPGSYSIRIDAPGYQSQELRQLELPIAALMQAFSRSCPMASRSKSTFSPHAPGGSGPPTW